MTSATGSGRTWLSLLPFLAAVMAVGVVGAMSATGVPQEYGSLEQVSIAGGVAQPPRGEHRRRFTFGG